MKRKILGLTVIVLAISLSAFHTAPAYKSLPSYWWFPLDGSSGQAQVIPHLVYQSFDPQACTNWAWGGYCSAAYNSFSGSYPYYSPAGNCVVIDYQLADME